MAGARTFKNLQYLSLADNRLGNANDGQAFERDQWCLPGSSPAMGWCPQPADNVAPESLQRMPNLLSLDISGNDLYGKRLAIGSTTTLCTMQKYVYQHVQSLESASSSMVRLT